MINLINDCREGHEPKYFCINSKGASFVFSHESDLKAHKEEEKHFYGQEYYELFKSGLLSELKTKYKVVPHFSKRANLRGSLKNGNYIKTNPFVK